MQNFFPKAVLFDFDGTLAQTNLDFPLMRVRVHEALQKLLPAALVDRYNLQKPALEAMKELGPLIPDERAGEVRSRVEQAIIDFEVEAARNGRLYPFTRPALERFLARNVKIGIVTRNCIQSVDIVFPDHAKYCSVIRTRHDVSQVKPHPEHLWSALAHMQTAPADALMVGDHPTDIKAGRDAGCKSAGVLTGAGTPENMRAAEPDYLAEDLGKLMPLLNLG
ncbi:MAG: HAD family hydrolase [Deltaproteobacteria bacterium]|jgi:phosphoglycolate phosphatase|nr:HAD family hydrolase [Deltaproteobacteria bacterium]